MPKILLNDGRCYSSEYPVSTLDLAHRIDPELGRICVAGCVGDRLIDSTDLLEEDVTLTIVTADSDLSSRVIRYSSVHLLGCAIKQTWPEARLATHLTLDGRFYYDADLGCTINSDDLRRIERKIVELIESGATMTRKVLTKRQAVDIFLERDESYKVEMLKIDGVTDDLITMIFVENYVDVCSEPQVPNFSFCRHLKLQSVSGVYWRDDRRNKMLQRIYGTAWNSQRQLDSYLRHLEEAARRDHRRINKRLDLYHLQEDSPGMIFWHGNGNTIFREIENFVRKKLERYHYQEVRSPVVTDQKLWRETGHWDNYSDHMFVTDLEGRNHCVKPMSCPGHMLIFSHRPRSYKDLPLRIAEFGICHRKESSGSLHGLMRTRSFTQDDAHIFCTPEQVSSEIKSCIEMLYEMYSTFGFKDVIVHLSTKPEQSVGDDHSWEEAEACLTLVLRDCGIEFRYKPGEGAFYGPKIEFILLDCLGRPWQCGTVQLDLALPKILNVTYVDRTGGRSTPVLIHRAILGSIERFIGILTEEYSGLYPTWLSPIQVVVMSLARKYSDYADEINAGLLGAGIRSRSDTRDEKIGAKIREHSLVGVPYMVVCGGEELRSNSVTARTRIGRNISGISLSDFIAKVRWEIDNHSLGNVEEAKD